MQEMRDFDHSEKNCKKEVYCIACLEYGNRNDQTKCLKFKQVLKEAREERKMGPTAGKKNEQKQINLWRTRLAHDMTDIITHKNLVDILIIVEPNVAMSKSSQ